jgi:hypothetical protein
VAHVIRDPIDPRQLTAMQFGTDSPWLQPWWAALVTPPATALRGAIGMNLDVSPAEALATAHYTASANSASAFIRPAFTPRYRVFMPEYLLTGIQTETLMRDLSLITTMIYDTPHGAFTHPPAPRRPRPGSPRTALTPTRRARLGCAGVRCPHSGPAVYPRRRGGLTMRAVRRLVATLHGAATIRHPRQLTLQAIAQESNAAQFAGGGTPALPPLYDRDVLAVFPFQVSAHRFVSAVYIMTRDLTHAYTSRPRATLTPYDMPAERFRLTIGNVAADYVRVSLSDPLTGLRLPVRVVARAARSVTVQLPVTDSPRMLTLVDRPIRRLY